MKYFKIFLALLALLFVVPWTFNHVSPWVAIGIVLLAIYFGVSKFEKFLKTDKS